MDEQTKPIIESFDQNFRSVIDLAEFDHVVLASAIYSITKIKDIQEKHLKLENPKYKLDQCLNQLKNIKENESMRITYKHIFNQCIVLLVSYFGAAISDLFEIYKKYFIEDYFNKKLIKEDIKFTIEELKENDFNLKNKFGEIFSKKMGISFQDMKSISNVFYDYMNFRPVKDEITNTIILAQACRHTIVHDGGIINRRVIKQVSKANPRIIKNELIEDTNVEFSIDEITTIGKCMKEYIKRLCSEINSMIVTTQTSQPDCEQN